ncbi:MAG: DUF899 family protein [Bdellovibrionales bacterium]|nr:DUF899 family protein [Bdellovibrionales bacterium]
MKAAKSDPVRLKIRKLENAMMKQKAELARLRRKAKLEPVADFALQTTEGKVVKLSSLFGKKNELILVHNMGSSCPYCTLWADGFNGLLPHLQDRAAFVIESPEAPKSVAAFRKKRGWKFPMVSSKGSPFRKGMGYQDASGDVAPGVSTFVKKGGKLYRVSDTGFGPGDNFCPAWDFFDLLPKKDWEAKFRY